MWQVTVVISEKSDASVLETIDSIMHLDGIDIVGIAVNKAPVGSGRP